MTDQHPDRASLSNVDVEVSVELGRREMTLAEARRLDKGNIISFPRLAGEAFDIMVNGRRFAEGEIVVVTDMMGIRITRLVDRKCKVSP